MQSLPAELSADKPALRLRLKELRDGIPASLRAERSRAMADLLWELPLYGQSKTVLFYAPIRSEVDLLPLAERALTEGKEVAFPISHTESFTLTFHRITEMEQLRTGAYGIREPDSSCPQITDLSEALCLVPALAFDLRGYRLGYGKGFYDRFLADFNGISLGICFGDCLVSRLPRGMYDRKVDLILTEGGVTTPYEAV